MQFNAIIQTLSSQMSANLPGLHSSKHPSLPPSSHSKHRFQKLLVKTTALLLLAQSSPNTYHLKGKHPKQDVHNLLNLAFHTLPDVQAYTHGHPWAASDVTSLLPKDTLPHLLQVSLITVYKAQLLLSLQLPMSTALTTIEHYDAFWPAQLRSKLHKNSAFSLFCSLNSPRHIYRRYLCSTYTTIKF